MKTTEANRTAVSFQSMHSAGVICGLAAGAWLGGAEVPAKLSSASLSPFAVSLCMVAGVFVARWTIPSLMKGSTYVFADIREKRHLIVWGILAGALWAVANTLTVVAIRDVGLTIAFPLWNTNCLVGIFWGWLLFRELRGAPLGNWIKVIGGAVAIVAAACVLAVSSVHGAGAAPSRALEGILAATGASLLWGTMYVPYRKAYISGMDPLSFVTIFTFGELGMVLLLGSGMRGGLPALFRELLNAREQIFWLFLGGLCWVVGDLFQQYATKYIGIGRAIPLSNTNQLWGMAWGALVFGELRGAGFGQQVAIVSGSLVMLLGALAISTSAAGHDEHTSSHLAIERECQRYALSYSRILADLAGVPQEGTATGRRWWDYLIAAVALGVFLLLGSQARRPRMHMDPLWMGALTVVSLVTLLVAVRSIQRDRALFRE